MRQHLRAPFDLGLIAVALVAVSASPAAPPDRRFAVTYARIVEGSAARHLVVRVKGPTKSIRIRVTLLRRTHVSRIAVRTIRTNRRVLVPRLSISAKITTVRVRIVGHVG